MFGMTERDLQSALTAHRRAGSALLLDAHEAYRRGDLDLRAILDAYGISRATFFRRVAAATYVSERDHSE